MKPVRHSIVAVTAVRMAFVLAVCGVCGVVVAPAQGQETAMDPGGSVAGAPDVAILPVVNNTELSEARAVLESLLLRGLTDAGLVLLPPAELRSLLRERRIRAVGSIAPAEARFLAETTGVRSLLIVSLDAYRAGVNPEVSLAARILDARDVRILAAASASATGEDFAGLFGIGRLEWIEDVADRVVAELLKSLLAAPRSSSRREDGCARIALVPLADLSGTPHADAVVGGLLLTELTARGYEVVEPGAVREIFLAERKVPKGRIGRPTIAALHSALEPCLLITGVVARFDPAQGNSEAAVPAVELGLRVLDGASGKLLLTEDVWMNGAETESVLGLGRERALASLTRRMIADVVDRIDNWKRTNLADNR